MPERLFIARLFLICGGVLAVAGLALGHILSIPGLFPPFLVTAALSLGYGTFCHCWRPRRASKK